MEQAAGEGVDGLELKSKVFQLLQELEQAGAHIHLPRADLDYTVTTGLRMLTMRRLIRIEDGMSPLVEGQGDLVTYYANSIRHLRHN